ncbi:MAG: hypothetical protein ACUZ8H_08885 [Candidatus Anammoxibacter sp.]
MKKLIHLIAMFMVVIFFSFSYTEVYAKPDGVAEQREDIEKNDCVVFLDTSLSMRGFFRPLDANPSPLQGFLQTEFRNCLSTNKLRPVFFARFEDDAPFHLKEDANIDNNFKYDSSSDIKKFFSNGSSDIVEVLMNDELYNHNVTVIITDAVQDNVNGFDLGSMIDVIESLIGKGLYINVIGIKSSFEGYVFPVLTVRSAPFKYNGLKPVYIWIVSHDAVLGDNLKNSIFAELKKRMGAVADENSLTSVCITDNSPSEIKEIVLDTSTQEDGILIIPRRKDIEVRLSRSFEGNKVVIPVKITKDVDYDDIYWNISLELFPEVEWASVELDENMAAAGGQTVGTLTINYDDMPKSWGGTSLQLRVNASYDDRKFWWRLWGTDDDSLKENADKTLYLGKLYKKIVEPHYDKYNGRDIKFLNLKILK